VTTADMLRAEGEAKGRAEGRAEGAATVLVRQLTRRFGPIPDTVRERINTATLGQLEAWSDRVLDAPTLDDVID
jgi:predicted transposase YdaD